MSEKFYTKIEDMPLKELTEKLQKVMKLKTYEKIRIIPYVGGDEQVNYKTDELIARCPMTGIIDFYELSLIYTPNKYLPELKSLKFYFMQFEEIGISHEHLASKIYDDFRKVIRPQELYVRLEVHVRGGIKTVVERGR